jgi:hypothetical protein
MSAVARHFRVRKEPISVNQGLKRAFHKTMVSFFHETVSSGPEKWVNGG